MIIFALGISALLVNWLVSFPAAAAAVLHPILMIIGIVFIVLGVAVVAEDYIREYRRGSAPPPPTSHRRW
jgi:hypothetical protein